MPNSIRIPMINNLLVSELIVEKLVHLGISSFVISPGSRSTPLTIAIARHAEAKSIIHYDERGAAYFALGAARASGLPAVLVCTSGTAVANYFPAIVEASMDNVPLIVLTADRPPELIDVGANQAIFQEDIFGIYPRLACNLAPTTSETSLSEISLLIDQMYHGSVENRPGPVHLNCQFREPLLPVGSESQDSLSSVMEKEDPSTSHPNSTPAEKNILRDQIQQIAAAFERSHRGIIVVGRGLSRDENQIVLQFAERMKIPVYPDIQSHLRFTRHELIVNHFDLILLDKDILSSKPDFVIHFGSAFCSKRLLNYLNSPDIYYVQIKSTPERIDPNHQINVTLEGNITEFCQSAQINPGAQDVDWLPHWQSVEEKAARTISNILKDRPKLSEPAISYQLSKHLPDNHALMLANSMPIREMEMFAEAGHFNGDIVVNRGSSGIDGLLATTAGYAMGSNAPITALIGDLAFLHDLNSLQLIKNASNPIILVVINNNGGGIFSFLPVRNETDVFEKFFGTPHDLSMRHAAEMFGISYSKPEDRNEFLAVYERAVEESGTILIELVTNRAENHRFHQEIFESIRETN